MASFNVWPSRLPTTPLQSLLLTPIIMNEHHFFINRRKGHDRRLDRDPCKNLPMDLYHRKRRKSTERRANLGIEADYMAYAAKDKQPPLH